MTPTPDYPVDAPTGVDPVIFRAQINQTMAGRYSAAMNGSPEPFTQADAYSAAMATWETDWSDDPNPRTIEAALAEVDGDLSYWGEE